MRVGHRLRSMPHTRVSVQQRRRVPQSRFWRTATAPAAAKSIPSPPTSAPLKPVLASVRDVEGVFVVFFVGSVGVVGPTGAALYFTVYVIPG